MFYLGDFKRQGQTDGAPWCQHSYSRWCEQGH